ncbi:MAG: NAD(P)/FAD-dependent oxidoreductase [Clostridiales bacterium]|nr:NAD(P)/FAD-dependent oxidoreductase [Clostridiales bacterium]
MENNNYDVTIIGGGPAGISTALYAARGGLNVLVIHNGVSALHRAEKIQNYYGTGEISGAALYTQGIAQAKSVGVSVIEGQVTFVRQDDENKFTVVTPECEYVCSRLVIATGAARTSLNVQGIKEFEGKGVSYCAVCDGFFYRKKTVAVIGEGEYALHEYNALKNIAEKVYLLTDGKAPSFTVDNTVSTKIKRISGEQRVNAVEFADGTSISVAGVFVAVGSMGSTAIAKSVGVFTDGNGAIVTDEHGMTNVTGLYAVGDCTAGIKQIGKAVADGIKVGLELVKIIRNK